MVDPAAFRWSDGHWRGLPLAEYIYLRAARRHIHPAGTSTPPSSGSIPASNSASPRRAHAGRRRPRPAQLGLRRRLPLRRTAHATAALRASPLVRRLPPRAGSAVVLDVVYNHLGPEGNYLGQFGPYFTGRYQTPWGDGHQLRRRRQRRRAPLHRRQRAPLAARVSCRRLRLDAVHAIVDDSAAAHSSPRLPEPRIDSPRPGAPQLPHRRDRREPPALRVTRKAGGYGARRQWSDDFHHAIHVQLTGERNGYYRTSAGSELSPRPVAALRHQGEPLLSEWQAARQSLPPGCRCLRKSSAPKTTIRWATAPSGERLTGWSTRARASWPPLRFCSRRYMPLLFMGRSTTSLRPSSSSPASKIRPSAAPSPRGASRVRASSDGATSPIPSISKRFCAHACNGCSSRRISTCWKWYRALLRLRREFIWTHERTARAWLSDDVLIAESPAHEPHLRILAAFNHAPLPEAADGWSIRLENNEDGHHVRVLVR